MCNLDTCLFSITINVLVLEVCYSFEKAMNLDLKILFRYGYEGVK